MFKDIEVHVVAHEALGRLLQRLEIPGKIGAIAQRLIDDQSTRLTFAHLGVKGRQIPMGGNQVGKARCQLDMGRIGGQIGQFAEGLPPD